MNADNFGILQRISWGFEFERGTRNPELGTSFDPQMNADERR